MAEDPVRWIGCVAGPPGRIRREIPDSGRRGYSLRPPEPFTLTGVGSRPRSTGRVRSPDGWRSGSLDGSRVGDPGGRVGRPSRSSSAMPLLRPGRWSFLPTALGLLVQASVDAALLGPRAMRTRIYLTVSCVALAAQGPAPSAEIDVDFRHAHFDNVALKLVGASAEQLVAPTERGLLVRIPPNEGVKGPVGVAPRAGLRGDFEVTAEYEFLRYDRPRDGTGAGVEMVVEFPGASAGAVSVERLAVPREGDRFVSAAGVAPPKRASAGSRMGKLRIRRTGSTVRAYYADGVKAFELLREQDVGGGDLVGVARLAAVPGSGAGRVEVIVKGLQIVAGELVEIADVPTTLATSSGRRTDWVVLSFATLDVALLAFMVWKWRPDRFKNRRKDRIP